MESKLAPEALLTRAALAEALTRAGFPITAKTLATKASRGNGPPFQHFGRKPLYQWERSLNWAKERLGPIVFNTAQRPVAKNG